MHPKITELRSALQQYAGRRPDVADVYEGPGELDQVEEFTVIFDDGQEFHIQIQEGACPAK